MDLPLKYSDKSILFLPIDAETEIQKIAAFSDIPFSAKNLLFFRCSVCKYSIRNTFIEIELIENVRPTLRRVIWVLFKEGEGKFTTFLVSQELQMV